MWHQQRPQSARAVINSLRHKHMKDGDRVSPSAMSALLKTHLYVTIYFRLSPEIYV